MLKLHAWIICKPRRWARVTKQFHEERVATLLLRRQRDPSIPRISPRNVEAIGEKASTG